MDRTWNEDEIICQSCGGVGLGEAIAESGAQGTCSLCGQHGVCLDFGEIARRVYGAYGNFYEAHRPVDPDAEPTGDTPIDVVREIIGDGAPAGLDEALTQHLHRFEAEETAGERELLFDFGDRYRRAGREIGGMLLSDTWVDFEEHLLNRVRYFDPVIEDFLEGVLEEVNTVVNSGETILPVGTTVYRARLLVDEPSAREALAQPEQNLGPPPRGRRKAGRLNPPGIAVFYGAFDEQTAVAELRPPVGGIVAYATFETIGPLRVLDLTQIHLAHVNLLLKDAEQRVNAADFLRQFHNIITRPAVDEDGLAYIPTQVVTEYLSKKGGFDGIIYKSVQVGERDHEARNLAIFDAEGVVVGTPAPKRLTDERGWEILNLPQIAPPRLRYCPHSARIVRVRAAQFEVSPMFDMGEYFIDSNDIAQGLR